MVTMQLDFSEDEDKIIELVKAHNSLGDKRDAVKLIVRSYDIKVTTK